MMPILQVRKLKHGAVRYDSIRHFSKPPLQESLGFHTPAGHRLTLRSWEDTGAQTFPLIPQQSVAEAGEEPGPPAPLGPSIPFWAVASSSCFRFRAVSQSGEREGEERKDISGAPSIHTPPASGGWRPWVYRVGGAERGGDWCPGAGQGALEGGWEGHGKGLVGTRWETRWGNWALRGMLGSPGSESGSL